MALAGVLLLSAACEGNFRTPTGLGGGGQGTGIASGGNGGSGSIGSFLVGTWVNVQLYRTDQDLIRVTTTWTFDAAGSCSRTVENYSLALGYPLTTLTSCTWAMQGSSVAITFSGSPGTVVYPVSTVNFSPDQVDIGGYLFDRQS